MKNGRKIVRIICELIKLTTLTCLCVFFAIIIDRYHQIKNYADALHEDLNISVFFDKNSNDNEKILEDINSTELVLIKEYVKSDEAYKRAVKKTPFLGNIPLPDNSKSVLAHAIVKPQSIPDDNLLREIKKTLNSIPGIDEVVFDPQNFLHYAKIQKQLLLYEKSFSTVVLIFLAVLIFKFLIVYFAGVNILKKCLRFFSVYTLSSSIGLLLFFIISKCYWHYSLLISLREYIFLVGLFGLIGIIFDKLEEYNVK